MRVRAVEAIQNLASALPEYRLDEVASVLVDTAGSPDVPASFDRLGHDDPLARFTFDMAPEEALRSASVRALAVLAKHRPEMQGRLADVVAGALASQVQPLVLAGLYALAQHPNLELGGISLPAFAVQRAPELRVAAAGALLAREEGLAASVLATMAQDPDAAVRRAAINSISTYGVPADTIDFLVDDHDCYNRVLVRAALGRAPSPAQEAVAD